MENSQELSANLHVSKVNDLNDVRRKLWDTAYSNIVIMNEVSKIITNCIGSENIDTLSYDMANYTITIITTRIMSNVEVTARFNVIFDNIVDILYKKHYALTNKEYEVCKSRVSLLYNLILNSNNTLIIKL